jgi:O-antigen/teichoic acid export membrane protein
MAVSGKFSKDSLSNLFAVGLSGVLYVLLNALIINQYDEAVLGVFNQAYAIYILLSQITVFGIHLSVQQFIPRNFNDTKKLGEGVTAALLATAVIALCVTIIAYTFTPLLSIVFSSQDVENAVQMCLWGVVLFSLNKVLFAFINGKRLMTHFAVFTLTRFVVMFLTAIVVMYVLKDSSYLVLSLVIPEFILFVVMLIHLTTKLQLSMNRQVKTYIKQHLRFGKKAFVGNLLLDINTRVDVVMLGVLLSDTQVGIYSFVLSVAEGILQIPVVFRNNINPIITKASVLGNVSSKLSKLLSKNIRAFYKIIGSIGLVAIICYPIGLWILAIDTYFWDYWMLFSILVGGIVLSSGYLPFTMIFNQLNLPSVQSRMFFWIFAINLVANFLLIKSIGLYGAAIGTSISYVSHVFLIKYFAKKYSKLNLTFQQ